MSRAAGVLTPLQKRDNQIRDLRIVLENTKGKAEIREIIFQDEIDALRRELSEKDKIIAMLQREIASLVAANEGLLQKTKESEQNLEHALGEIQRLKSILDKNSSNSSKPPSTDGFTKIPAQRAKSQRPSGGQTGHPGHRLQLPSNLDDLVADGVAEIKIVDHTGGCGEYVSRWTMDVQAKVIVTEHRFPKGQPLPKSMENEVAYGDGIKAMTVLLSNEGIIAEERLSGFFSELTRGAIHPSDATIESFLNQFARLLPTELDAIAEDLLWGKVMHVDETPLRCAQKPVYSKEGEQPVLETAKNTTFDVTLRNHSNERSTLYTVNPQKDMNGIDRDDILPQYGGILSHDHDKKFYHYGTGHATCGGHLLRDLKGLLDLQNCPWAGRMISLMNQMNSHKNDDLRKGVDVCDEKLLAQFVKQYDSLLSDGRDELNKLKENELGYKELRAMLNRLFTYKECYLLFMRDYSVPFTNNLSERDLRPSKTRQKVSGCFRTWHGVETYAKIRSFISTAKKRRLNLFHSISCVFNGLPVFASQEQSNK